jgi:hypothetical protein
MDLLWLLVTVGFFTGSSVLIRLFASLEKEG